MDRARKTTYSSNIAGSSPLLVERESGTIFLDGNLAADNKNLEYVNVF